jgi:cardiolipin synthase C
MVKTTNAFLFFVFLICCQPNLKADYYRFLTSENDAMQCRFDLIQTATTEILVSCYIIKDDEVGMALISALLDARLNRGVRVYVLMDGNASKVSPYLVSYMTERGIEFKEFYLEKAAGVRRYYHRLHDKMLLADGYRMIVGGRNIKNSYFSLHKKHNFKDREVYVESATAGATARTHFYYMFHAKRLTSRVKAKKPNERRSLKIAQQLDDACHYVCEKCAIRREPRNDWPQGLPRTETEVRFVHDYFYSKTDSVYTESLLKDLASTEALLDLIEHAEHSITLENPYIVPTRKWQRAFDRAAKRGVKIRLLTNSIKSNDVLVSQAAYLNRRKKLLKLGIEIWEHQGPKHFHSKTATIDDCISITGSYNIHTPSERFNSEVAVWVYDAQIATAHREHIEEYMKEAVQIGSNNRPIPSTYPNYQKTKWHRRATTFLLRWSVAWAFGNVL